MRTRLGAVACMIVASVAVQAGQARAADGTPDRTLGPKISGTSSYVGGTYVWTDYAYDDRGPNTNPLEGGDAVYPSGSEPGNVADLVQLQLRTVPDGLAVTAVLEALVDPSLPLLAVGFDTDADPSSGAAAIPGGAWTNKGPLGLEKLAVISDAGWTLHSWNGAHLDQAGAGAATVDANGNTMSATLPLHPDGATWRAVGLLGVSTASFLAGAGPIFDLAFVHAEDPSVAAYDIVLDAGAQVFGQATGGRSGSAEWQDHVQANILVHKADASLAAGVIDFAKVDAGVTELATADRPGWHTFLYHSPLAYGEGFQTAPSALGGSTRFAGPYQPYGVIVPPNRMDPTPLVVYLHGANQNHLVNRYNFVYSPTTELVAPGHADPNAVVVFPLGRDPAWTTGPAEQDVLDVMDGVATFFDIDDDRVVLTGMSAGGGGTMRFSELYPDRFAGAVPKSGGGASSIAGNLVNLPVRGQYGGAEAGLILARGLETSLDARGDVDYRTFVPAFRSHTPNAGLVGCFYRAFIERGRDTDPARVVYGIDPAKEVSDDPSGLVLRHTGAYWVSGMAARDADAMSAIDVTSLARSDRVRAAAPVDRIGQNATEGADYCGPNPGLRSGDVWREHGVSLSAGPAAPATNEATVELSNLAAATVDLDRMSLSTDGPLGVTASSDGPATLRLAGPWSGDVTVTRDGEPAGTLSPSGGAVELEVDGAHTYVLTP